MIWEALLYGAGMFAGAYLVRSACKAASGRRWYNVTCLQGMGLMTWGAGNLLTLVPLLWVQKICLPVSFLTYTFFLLSLHALQRVRLAYELWKTVWDSVTLVATFTAIALLSEMASATNGHLPLLFHIEGGLFLLIPAFTMLAEKGQDALLHAEARIKQGGLILATCLFAVYLMLRPFETAAALVVGGAVSIACLLLAHNRSGEWLTARQEMPEYRRLFQRLAFCKWDAIMAFVMLLLSAAVLVVVPAFPSYGKGGLWAAILLGGMRCWLTIRGSRQLLERALQAATELEHQCKEQMALAKKSSQQLAEVLGHKENYQYLLVASNEYSMREVTFETLQHVMEELVGTWYDRIDSLVHLSLSLESEARSAYFTAARGERTEQAGLTVIQERIVVHEKLDTALTPRYVVMEVWVREDSSLEKELESFFQLLLVSVRGLTLRCLQHQQSRELRDVVSELELARRVQSLLVPKEELVLPALRARSLYMPFTYVGGDYIDCIRINERYTCFIVADVSGHGLSASLLAAGIRTAVRAVLQKSLSPDEVLARINQLLFEDLSRTRSYITMIVCLYDGHEHALLVSRAGHPQPLYLSAGKRGELPCAGGVGLGLLPDSTYKLEKVPLREPGLLLLYTDGLVDKGRKEGHRFQSWLSDLALILDKHEHDDRAVMNQVESYIREITRGRQQHDDISVLILQFQGTERTAAGQPVLDLGAFIAPATALDR
ncbi:PP2C family protein-serine/threonine phosphatase [Brevibacillus sp. GCM10020057]|uniref:PP2C family protein-serine/threonine phosphatase n=1 Tax=Brevibacillus sp. GCM10020057 TaxID=3317327 RepID=UPI003636D51C